MSVKEQQRQNKIVLRIRELQNEKNQRGGLSFEEGVELVTLQTEANENNWLYW